MLKLVVVVTFDTVFGEEEVHSSHPEEEARETNQETSEKDGHESQGVMP